MKSLLLLFLCATTSLGCSPLSSTPTSTTTTTTTTSTLPPLLTTPAPAVKVLVRKEVGNHPAFFDKTFAEYQEGFSANGLLKEQFIQILIQGESWLGLDKLHNLTSQQSYKLKIIMTDFDGKEYVAVYDQFKVMDKTIDIASDLASEDQIRKNLIQVGPADGYVLTLGGFNAALSTLGDAMSADANGMKFSTK